MLGRASSVLVAVALFGLVSLGGCGATPAAAAPDFADAPAYDLPSVSGHLVVTVRSSPPRPGTGVNAVQLTIVDDRGAPVDGAAVTATPWMPAHGHGTSVVPSISARGDGVYEIDRVLFFMPGRWELRAEIVPEGQAPDHVVATFDVL